MKCIHYKSTNTSLDELNLFLYKLFVLKERNKYMIMEHAKRIFKKEVRNFKLLVDNPLLRKTVIIRGIYLVIFDHFANVES